MFSRNKFARANPVTFKLVLTGSIEVRYEQPVINSDRSGRDVQSGSLRTFHDRFRLFVSKGRLYVSASRLRRAILSSYFLIIPYDISDR